MKAQSQIMLRKITILNTIIMETISFQKEIFSFTNLDFSISFISHIKTDRIHPTGRHLMIGAGPVMNHFVPILRRLGAVSI